MALALDIPQTTGVTSRIWDFWNFLSLGESLLGQVGSTPGIYYFLKVPSPNSIFLFIKGDSDVSGNLWHSSGNLGVKSFPIVSGGPEPSFYPYVHVLHAPPPLRV